MKRIDDDVVIQLARNSDQVLSELAREVAEARRLTPKAQVILFKPSGKYYTQEEWRIPQDAIGPAHMAQSPDFHRIDGGLVLVETQEPWGYPHLL